MTRRQLLRRLRAGAWRWLALAAVALPLLVTAALWARTQPARRAQQAGHVPAGHWAASLHSSRGGGNLTADAALQAARQQLAASVHDSDARAALAGARLPRGVQLEAARQLLLDAQLLRRSLAGGAGGHAAARVRALRQHFNATSSGSAGADAGGGPAAQRGVLIVGGSRSHLGNALILMTLLRQQLGCKLPIEVVHYGPQELDPEAAALVQRFAAEQAASGAAPVTLIDGAAVHAAHLAPLAPQPAARLAGFVAKVHALCWVTSFREVLLLDADNLALQDPEPLFDSPAFQRHGVIAWPDFWRDLWMRGAVYRLLNLTAPWEDGPSGPGLAAESGQLYLDRARHADVLEWLWLLNAHAGLVYRCVVGDKDTYRMAFELAGKSADYFQVPHPPRELLADTGSRLLGRFAHLGMGQVTPDGSALAFMHRTASGKFFPWCAASVQLRRLPGGCHPAWISAPVVQQQLLQSMRVPGSMHFGNAAIDTSWWRSACHVAADDGRAGRGGPVLLPVCSGYSRSQLPIPAIPADALPGLPLLASVIDRVFDELAGRLAVQPLARLKVWLGIL